jgi:hypothetical protein
MKSLSNLTRRFPAAGLIAVVLFIVVIVSFYLAINRKPESAQQVPGALEQAPAAGQDSEAGNTSPATKYPTGSLQEGQPAPHDTAVQGGWRRAPNEP